MFHLELGFSMLGLNNWVESLIDSLRPNAFEVRSIKLLEFKKSLIWPTKTWHSWYIELDLGLIQKLHGYIITWCSHAHIITHFPCKVTHMLQKFCHLQRGWKLYSHSSHSLFGKAFSLTLNEHKTLAQVRHKTHVNGYQNLRTYFQT